MSQHPEVTLIPLRFGRDRGYMPPLGPLSLAGALEQAGCRWKLIDTQSNPRFHPFAVDQLEKLLLTVSSDFVGLSVFNDALPLVISALDRMKGKSHPKIILGGPGVVGVARKLMDRLRALDAVVVGEGETALPAIMLSLVKPPPMTGIFVRDANGGVVGTGRTPREDLNTVAQPAWEWCKGQAYNTVPLSTMRGCAFSCSFCEIIAYMGRRVTRVHMDKTIENLRAAMDAIGSNEISVVDDTFTISRRHVDEFCKRLLSERISASFSIFSRTDTISEGQMELLAAAGCRRVFFGIDSGDNDMLRAISKNISVDSAIQTVKTAANYFPVIASFIWGYPFETFVAFRNTIDVCKELLACNSVFGITPQLHLLSPSAGTDLFENHGDRLIYDETVEVLPLPGGSLSQPIYQSAEEVLDVIREEPILAAPFYRYQTPCFVDKLEMAEEFADMLFDAIGTRVINAMKSTGGRRYEL